MTSEPTLLMSLDLAGTFIYALNGGLTAVRAARLDIVGVVTLAMVSGLGGGIIRDILLGAVPPAAFTVFDAAGLGLFAVTGSSKALGAGARVRAAPRGRRWR